MANKSIGIFKNIDLTSTNELGNRLQVSGHIIPAGWTDNNAIDEDVINDTSHNYKLIDSVFIDWNGANLGTINGIEFGTINTTSDLLNAIKLLAQAINTTPAPIENQDPTYTAPSAKSGLTYDGTDKQLINAGNVNAGGTMKYSLNNSTWSTSIPTGKNAGTYTVYWKIDASSGYNNVETSSINVIIAKANITTITPPTAKTGLTYSGSEQVLINAGSASTDGTMYYKVNTGSFTSLINDIKETNAGSYTITYYAKGDSNHNDSQQATITVSIAKATPTIIVNNPASTIIADGETTSIIVESNTPGSLKFSSNGAIVAGGNNTAWQAKITTTTPQSFTIVITNNTYISEQSTIATNNSSTKLTFTPSNNNYNNVSDIYMLTQAITLSAAASQTTYYWYVGTTKPTSLSDATVVTSYSAEQTYTNNSGAKSHIFVLTNSDKNVTFINIATGNPVDQNEIDTTTIPRYKIFETAVGTANTGSIKIRIS